MSSTMRRSRVRYTNYEEAEYVLDTTKPGKRVVQELDPPQKLTKLLHDDDIDAHKHWRLVCGIKYVLSIYPIVEPHLGASNERRNAHERAEEKIAEVEWSNMSAMAQLKAQHEAQIKFIMLKGTQEFESERRESQAHLKVMKSSHDQTVSERDAEIAKQQRTIDEAMREGHVLVEQMGQKNNRISRLENDLNTEQMSKENAQADVQKVRGDAQIAFNQQQGELEDQNNTIASLKQEVSTERTAKEDAEAKVRHLTHQRSSLEQKIDQHDEKLVELQSRNEELVQSQWLNAAGSSVDEMASAALQQSYDEANTSLSEADTAVARLHTVARTAENIDQDALMTDSEPKSVAQKCDEIASELQRLREANASLTEAKSAAEKEATQAQEELDDFILKCQKEMANDDRDQEIRKEHKGSFVQHDPRDDLDFYGREQIDGDVMDSSMAETGSKEGDTRPKTAASLTSSVSSDPESLRSKSQSTTSQATAATTPSPQHDDELSQMSRTPLPTPKSTFSSSCGGSASLATTTQSAMAAKTSPKGSMRDYSKPQHRSTKYTPVNAPAKGSVGKTVSASEKRKTSAKVQERIEAMFETHLEDDPEARKRRVLCQMELESIRGWCAKAGPTITKVQLEQEKRKRTFERIQNWLDFVFQKHQDYTVRGKELEFAIDGEDMLLEAFSNNAVFGRNSEHFLEAPDE